MCGRFQGINTSQSLREKPSSGSSSGNLKELRLRKSSQTEGDKGGQTDDEIVESCKVRTIELYMNLREVFTMFTFQMTYDATGCFHWCPSRNFDDCVMTRQVTSGCSVYDCINTSRFTIILLNM